MKEMKKVFVYFRNNILFDMRKIVVSKEIWRLMKCDEHAKCSLEFQI